MQREKWASRPVINIEYRCLLYLLNCGIHEAMPSRNCMQKADLRKVADIANSQGVLATIAYPMLAFWQDNPDLKPDFADSLRGFVAKNQRKTIVMDMERERISAELESRGIWHMPLKGVIIKDMYPDCNMREMSDNDILYDGEFIEQICDLFNQWGYEIGPRSRQAHISFVKGDCHFEMHTRLINSRDYPVMTSYYDGFFDKMLTVDGKKYEKAMSDEDFYIFMVVHAYKHYFYCGIGIRILVDMKLYLMQKTESMDWSYIREQFRLLQLTEFEQELRETTLTVMPDSLTIENDPITSLTDGECRLLYLLLTSGAFGTRDNIIKKRIGRIGSEKAKDNLDKARNKYLLHRLFPGRSWFRKSHPFLYKVPVLIPGFWFYRIGKMIFTKPEIALDEARRIKKMDENAIRYIPK